MILPALPAGTAGGRAAPARLPQLPRRAVRGAVLGRVCICISLLQKSFPAQEYVVEGRTGFPQRFAKDFPQNNFYVSWKYFHGNMRMRNTEHDYFMKSVIFDGATSKRFTSQK